MARKLPDLIRRQQALEKTARKYRGRVLDFDQADCVRMARSHLVAMGHRGLPQLPRYSSLSGAQRALKAGGWASLEEMLDSLLPRITPAAMLPGDLALMRGEEETELDSIVISMGQKVLGWYEGKCAVLIPYEIKAAYRA